MLLSRDSATLRAPGDYSEYLAGSYDIFEPDILP